MKKIVYIVGGGITKKFIRHWFISYFLKKYHVELWNVEKILKWKKYNDAMKILSFFSLNIINLNSIKDLENQIIKNKKNKVFFVLGISYFYNTINIYRALSKHKAFMVFFNWGFQPQTKRNLNKLFNKISFFNNYSFEFTDYFKNFFKIFYSKFFRITNLVNKYDISFNAGSIASDYSFGKKNILINLCDYDDYLDNKNINKINNYSVFLDVDLPNAFDANLFAFKKNSKKNYYKTFSIFFNSFEKKFKTKVFIAKYPSSNNVNKYLGKKSYNDQTAKLVKNCQYVLSHHSTSISYAILNYKPIIFIYNNDMINSYEYKVMKNFAEFLDSKLIKIEDFCNQSKYNYNFLVNKKKYDSYKYKFIISKKNKNLRNHLIVDKQVKNFFNDSLYN